MFAGFFILLSGSVTKNKQMNMASKRRTFNILAVIPIITAVLFWQPAPVSADSLRARSYGERLDSIIPAASQKVSRGSFLDSVEMWIDAIGLTRTFGRLDLLRQGYIHFDGKLAEDGSAFETSVNIVPDTKSRILGVNGLYADGNDCAEGAWRLLKELRSKGYKVRGRKAPAGIWANHVYVEVRFQEEWISISTTPDMPHIGFPVYGKSKIVPDSTLEMSFTNIRKGFPLPDQDTSPLEFFYSREGRKVLICANMGINPSEKGLPILFATIGCFAYILDDEYKYVSYGMEIPVPLTGIFCFQNMRPSQLKGILRAVLLSEERRMGVSETTTIQDARAHIVEAGCEMLMRIDAKSALRLTAAWQRVSKEVWEETEGAI